MVNGVHGIGWVNSVKNPFRAFEEREKKKKN